MDVIKSDQMQLYKSRQDEIKSDNKRSDESTIGQMKSDKMTWMQIESYDIRGNRLRADEIKWDCVISDGLIFRLNHWRSQGQPQWTMLETDWLTEGLTDWPTVSFFWPLPASVKLYQLLLTYMNFYQPPSTFFNLF